MERYKQKFKNPKEDLKEGYNELMSDIVLLFSWYPNIEESTDKLVKAIDIAIHDAYHSIQGNRDDVIDLIIKKLLIAKQNVEAEPVSIGIGINEEEGEINPLFL